ncbi:transglycosylase domain-containing protein [Dysgonomonas sp. 216]|uniref:transglycosylase domain-containing protein n=1 Tax=Dysgonomonas sp. 216 TaxID=2302934 RepID=UPI00351A1413
MHKIIITTIWGILATVVISIALVFILIANGKIGYMPPIEDLENPINKYASQTYSFDGELLGTYSMEKENRIYSNYEDLSPYLIEALIATEDIRFHEHSGIDAYALGRAVVKRAILQQKSGGGGSTVSQQLAKLLYSPKADNWQERVLQKPIEWVIAVQLERYYTKEDIINLYLNKFDFLNNAVGIQSAAQVYFNKAPKDLKIEEAAMLIGMCKNPSLYNPNNPRKRESTRGRRNVVLDQMRKAGYISDAQADSLKQLPLELDFRRVDHKDGLAPYFREYLRMIMTAKKPVKSKYKQWQKDQYERDSMQWETNPLYGWCNKKTKSDGSNYNLYTDGLKIYTTIDSRMQKYAEESVEEHIGGYLQPIFTKEKKGRSYGPFSYSVAKRADSLIYSAMKITDRYAILKKQGLSDAEIYKVFKQPAEMKVFSWKGEIDTIMTPWDSIRYHKGFLRSGFMAMSPGGQVKAYVGGINYKYFQYDMINAGRRQIGSTIKPFLYTLSMQDGITPCDEMLHVEQVLTLENGKEWIPRNANKKRIGEMVTIKWGLQNSDNWVTAYLMSLTTPYSLVRMLHSFGITGYIDPVVSLSLGTCDVSVGEMTAAYTAFVNKGIRANPLYVTRIEDARGNILESFTPQMQEVFDETTSVKILDMMRAVIDGGTGGRVRRDPYSLKGPMGGKTGTTQNNSDGWFMAFTPQIVAGCWVGGEDRSIRFDGMREGQGASMALPVYAKFMSKVYADPSLGYSPEVQFEKVKGSPNPCTKADTLDEILDNQPAAIDDMFN